MSTFNKIYKKVANNGNSNDYQQVGTVGVNGVNLDIMKGANSSSAGEIGLVPKPSAGASNRYLRSDGTWSVPPDNNTTYNVFTGNNNGLVPATDKGTYFLTGNGSWGYPWIGSWAESGKTILCLGSGDDQLSKNELPEATESANGLMSATDKSRLNKLNNNIFIKIAGSFEANGNKHWTSFTINEWTTLDLTSAKTYQYQNRFVGYNSNTIIIKEKGLYLFHFYFGYNTYSGRITLSFFRNGEVVSQTSMRLCTYGDRELYDNRLTALYLGANDTIQLKITTADTKVSNYIIPHYFGIYCLDYENKY